MSHFKYIVLGGGNASGYAARQFVKLGGAKGELAIITDEQFVSYERPALSKAYLFPENPARLPGFHACVGVGGDRQDESWYEAHGITYLTETKVTGLDVKSKMLLTQHGTKLGYDKLIVATGARPITLQDLKAPGSDLKGVHYLRNIRDADALVAAMKVTKSRGGKALCIGGGYIGMECAAALCMNGLDVTMVFPESRLFERLFTPEISEFYEAAYKEKGIRLLKGSLCQSLHGENGMVKSATLSDGTNVECSLVIVGIGARPNIELFAGQLDTLSAAPGGIKVDGQLRTSDDSVWAIGDVAAFPQTLTSGKLMRQEHVTNCRESAAFVMASVMGEKPADYEYLPFFYSRVFQYSWQFYGQNSGLPVHFGNQENAKFGAFWVDDGKIVGGFYEGGSPEDFSALKAIVSKQPEAPSDLGVLGLSLASRL